MKSRTAILLIVLFLFSGTEHFLVGQNTKIDSLHQLIRKNKEDTFKVNNLDNLAAEYILAGEYDSALVYNSAALKLAEQLDFKSGIGSACFSFGTIYTMKTNYP